MELIWEVLARMALWLLPGSVVGSTLGIALAIAFQWQFPGIDLERAVVGFAVVGFVAGALYDLRTGGLGSGPGLNAETGSEWGPSLFSVCAHLLVASAIMVAEVALVMHVMR